MLLQNRFNQIDSQIASVDSQIAKLQAQLSELQQHRQHLQSVEQACESALTQIDTALMMLNHVDPDCVATFKDAVLAKFDGAIATLPEAPEIVNPTESEPINPTEPEPNTITVEATETDNQSDNQSDTPSDTETDTEPRPLASVGSSGFNPSTADLDILKRWVRSHQGDDVTRKQGTLTRRSTWEHAAKSILSNL
ncbi:hypothetical protein [Planktothrix sp.]|uniref:hypothetical protein n=1 Tax=Planktothrix sp. TaxID=3088171 RepID=UPI0038D4B929